MGAIFNTPQRAIDFSNPAKALKQIYSEVQAMQSQLEFTLQNLDSTNITEISTAQTKIIDGSGENVLQDGQIQLTSGNLSFRAGYDSTAKIFRFEVTDNTGTKVLYLNSSGELVISKNTTLSIDGGTWQGV